MVENHQADMWLGAYRDEQPFAVYPEYHIDIDQVCVVMKAKPGIEWLGQQVMAHKRVGWIEGYGYEDYIEVPVRFYPIADRATAFRMLLASRLDFYIDARIDVVRFMRDQQIAASKLSLAPYQSIPIYPAFNNDVKGNALRDHWDKGMQRLIESGILRDIYLTDPETPYPYQ